MEIVRSQMMLVMLKWIEKFKKCNENVWVKLWSRQYKFFRWMIKKWTIFCMRFVDFFWVTLIWTWMNEYVWYLCTSEVLSLKSPDLTSMNNFTQHLLVTTVCIYIPLHLSTILVWRWVHTVCCFFTNINTFWTMMIWVNVLSWLLNQYIVIIAWLRIIGHDYSNQYFIINVWIMIVELIFNTMTILFLFVASIVHLSTTLCDHLMSAVNGTFEMLNCWHIYVILQTI